MRRPSHRIYVFPMITAWISFLTAVSSWAEPCPCVQSPCLEGDEGASWIFRPSYFSHDPDTGKRVVQYAQTPKVYLPYDPTYRESGFHYTQQILRGPYGSVDALHLIQSWGEADQIRPYGEWQFPYRAGATPYGPWGNPQGPWTLPFDSWQNPYGLGRLPNPPWPVWPFNNAFPRAVPFGNSNSPMAPSPGFAPSPQLNQSDQPNNRGFGGGIGQDENP
jgi:hypothetical protein